MQHPDFPDIFEFENFKLKGFRKSVLTDIWSRIPANSACGESQLQLGPVVIPITGCLGRVRTECSCCVTLGGYDLCAVDRDRLIDHLLKSGCLFENKSLVASAIREGEFLTLNFQDKRVALVRRTQAIDEIKALVECRSCSSIVDLVGIFQDVDRSWLIATPFTPYGDLYTALCRRSFTFMHANRLLSQILHAISFLHAHGWVHRDVKPENI